MPSSQSYIPFLLFLSNRLRPPAVGSLKKEKNLSQTRLLILSNYIWGLCPTRSCELDASSHDHEPNHISPLWSISYFSIWKWGKTHAKRETAWFWPVAEGQPSLGLKRRSSSGHGRAWRCPFLGAEYYTPGHFLPGSTPQDSNRLSHSRLNSFLLGTGGWGVGVLFRHLPILFPWENILPQRDIVHFMGK